MFRLHEQTQRRICRIAFIALCLAPTVGVALWAGSTHLPSRRRAMGEWLTDQFGFAVEIERARAPRPGEFQGNDVTVCAERGGRPLATIDQIGAAPLRDSAGTVWRIAGVETAASSLQEIASIFWQASRFGGESHYLFVDQLRVTPPEQATAAQPLRISNFRLRSTSSTDGGFSSRQIGVRLQQADSSNDIAMRLETSPGAADHATETWMFEFSTGGATLPCWVLESWLPAAAHLGPAARFTGKGKVTVRSQGTDVELTGMLTDVEFLHAFDSIAGKVDASGTIRLDSLRMHDGRLEFAKGAVSCNSGGMDRQLVDAAAGALYCVRTVPPESSQGRESSSPESNRIRFDELAFQFSIDSTGMTLWGTCESAAEGTMMAKDGRSLLSQPQYRALPVAKLVYLVAPEAPHYIPATLEAQSIAKRLPFPSVENGKGVAPAAEPKTTDAARQ